MKAILAAALLAATLVSAQATPSNEETPQGNKILASSLNRHGYAYHAMGDYDRAIADYDEAIRISPEYVPAYHDRGFAYFAKGELDRAIADYTEAIRLNQQHAISYRNRGIAHLYSGSPAKAQADLETAIQLTPKDAYLALWQEIAERRANAPSTLAHAVSQIDMATWPAPIARFLLGESTQAALLASAKDSDSQKSRERLCEANFFVGQLALQRGSKEEARRAFQIAGRDCPPQFLERGAAGAELRALDNKQGADQPREAGAELRARAEQPREGAMIGVMILTAMLLIVVFGSGSKAGVEGALAARERARQQEEEERQKAAARERARQQEEEERQRAEAARKRQREQEEASARKRQREQEEAAARERARQQEKEERRRNSLQGKLSEPQALEILGLNAGATKQEIRAAYNRLMKRVHPDVGGSNFFTKKLNEARETLCGAL